MFAPLAIAGLAWFFWSLGERALADGRVLAVCGEDLVGLFEDQSRAEETLLAGCQ